MNDADIIEAVAEALQCPTGRLIDRAEDLRREHTVMARERFAMRQETYRLHLEVEKLREALRWYVENDATPEGGSNEVYHATELRALRKARALLGMGGRAVSLEDVAEALGCEVSIVVEYAADVARELEMLRREVHGLRVEVLTLLQKRAEAEWKARRCECGADDACAFARERDEARAEVDRLRSEVTNLRGEMIAARAEERAVVEAADRLTVERDQARAEVEQLSRHLR